MPKIKVRFHLGSPLYYNTAKKKQPLLLDSVLSYIWAAENGYKKTSAENIAKNLVFIELPIKRVGKCYMASGMCLPKSRKTKNKVAASRSVFAKRSTQQVNLGKCVKSFPINGTSPSYKPVLMKSWLIHVPYIDFYADVTDREEFERLCNQVKNYGLGAKTSIGFGRVVKVSFKDYEGDMEYVTPEGIPTRPLPVADFAGKVNPSSTIGMSTYYAPYWFIRNQAACYQPPAMQYMVAPEIDEDTLYYMKEDILKTFAG